MEDGGDAQLARILTAEKHAAQQQLDTLLQYRADYRELEATLRPLGASDGVSDRANDAAEREIMVPLTSRAFMPGHLVRDDRVLVLLGENLFVGAQQYCWAFQLVNYDNIPDSERCVNRSLDGGFRAHRRPIA